MLSYVHGGLDGALFGAWDFLQRYAPTDVMEKLLHNYKRGKFLEKLYGRFSGSFQKGDVGMNKALAQKYLSFMSRRKYIFQCKLQSCMFDKESDSWKPNSISYGDYNINLKTATISHSAIEKFVKCILQVNMFEL